MSDTVLSSGELDKLLSDKDRHLILHTMEGEIIGASASACRELGYSQDEIVQILLANIKAHTVRLSDVCIDHRAKSTPVIFQRRNGRRFAANVDNQVIRATVNRDVRNIVQMEFHIQQPGASVDTALPQLNLQESADYLELLSEEIQSPLTTVGLFLESLSHDSDDGIDRDKLEQALAAREQLTELVNDVADWFKIGTNLLALDRRPFNLVELLDRIVDDTAQLCNQAGIEFSLCIDDQQRELVFGDAKRLRQLLYRLIIKLVSVATPGELQLSVSSGRGSDSHFAVVFSLSLFSDVTTSTSRPHSPAYTQDSTLGIVSKLITVMGGTFKIQEKSDHETEYVIQLALPDVDMLDIDGNTQFLSGHSVILIDEHKSLLKQQLIHWGAVVEGFSSLAKAMEFLSHTQASANYNLTLCYLNGEQEHALGPLQQVLPTSRIVNIGGNEQLVLDTEGVSLIPSPVQVGLLGNSLALLFGVPLPYPYSHHQRDRILNLNDTKKRILFVDDVETIRMTFRAMLGKSGYEVDLAHNGIDAILACTQKCYDIIIVDIQMPYMDGLEATNHIRKSNNFNNETPVLAVSGDTSTNTKLVADRVGIQDILAKPVAMEDLLARINQLTDDELEIKRGSDEEALKDLLFSPGRRAYEQPPDKQPVKCLNTELLVGLIEDTSLETCMEMIEIFMEESKRSVRIIDQEAHHNNWDKVMHEAHAIKSTSYTFGCEALYNISAQLEEEIESADHFKCTQTVDEMAAVFSESYLALEEFFRQAQIPPGGAPL